jgi:hypothetical protein
MIFLFVISTKELESDNHRNDTKVLTAIHIL